MSVPTSPRLSAGRRLPHWLRLILLSAIPVVALGMLALGFWQLSRLAERRALNATIAARLDLPRVDVNTLAWPADPAPLDFRPALAQGVFDYDQEIVWRTQAYNGAPGVHVITPLRLAEGGPAVLVDRGWIPYTLAEARTPFREAEAAVVIGVLRVPARPLSDLRPRDPATGPGLPRLDAWFWLDVDALAAQMGYALAPMVLVRTEPVDPAQLPIPNPSLALDEGPHLTYAIQWFSFAAIAVAGPLAYVWQQRRGARVGRPAVR